MVALTGSLIVVASHTSGRLDSIRMDGRIRTAGLFAPMALSHTDLGSQSPLALGVSFIGIVLSEAFAAPELVSHSSIPTGP